MKTNIINLNKNFSKNFLKCNILKKIKMQLEKFIILLQDII